METLSTLTLPTEVGCGDVGGLAAPAPAPHNAFLICSDSASEGLHAECKHPAGVGSLKERAGGLSGSPSVIGTAGGATGPRMMGGGRLPWAARCLIGHRPQRGKEVSRWGLQQSTSQTLCPCLFPFPGPRQPARKRFSSSHHHGNSSQSMALRLCCKIYEEDTRLTCLLEVDKNAINQAYALSPYYSPCGSQNAMQSCAREGVALSSSRRRLSRCSMRMRRWKIMSSFSPTTQMNCSLLAHSPAWAMGVVQSHKGSRQWLAR